MVNTPGYGSCRSGTHGGVAEAFPRIEELAFGCRYADCQHEREPGCRVRAALSDGTLDPARFENYRRMRRELAYQVDARPEGGARAQAAGQELCKMIARLPKRKESAAETSVPLSFPASGPGSRRAPGSAIALGARAEKSTAGPLPRGSPEDAQVWHRNRPGKPDPGPTWQRAYAVAAEPSA